MSCNHKEYDEYDETFDTDEDGNLVEIRNYICRDCGARATKRVVHYEIVWPDPNQTQLPLL